MRNCLVACWGKCQCNLTRFHCETEIYFILHVCAYSFTCLQVCSQFYDKVFFWKHHSFIFLLASLFLIWPYNIKSDSVFFFFHHLHSDLGIIILEGTFCSCDQNCQPSSTFSGFIICTWSANDIPSHLINTCPTHQQHPTHPTSLRRQWAATTTLLLEGLPPGASGCRVGRTSICPSPSPG